MLQWRALASLHGDTAPKFGGYPKATTELGGVTGYQEVAGGLVEIVMASRVCFCCGWTLRPLSEKAKGLPGILADAKMPFVSSDILGNWGFGI
jgi:hypothetical protein